MMEKSHLAVEPNPQPVEIPVDLLSAEALIGIINDFIGRDGTDYGLQEITHDKKAEQIRRQIAKGDIRIIFEATSESVTLITEKDWLRYRHPASGTDSSNS